MSSGPLVSVVTPARNMARFLRDTIESVLAQDYPHVEYLVLDGASTDGTIELLRSYGDRIRWVSEPDRGQADAINKGFRLTRGGIFAFLNADDTYLPGAITAAVRAFAAHPDAAVVYGEANHVDEKGQVLAPYPTGGPEQLERYCAICQPASFVRREAFPGVDESLSYALDYDLWLRMAAAGQGFLRIPEVLATSRMHTANKTLGSRGPALREAIDVVHRNLGYAGFEPLYGYACWQSDGRDQFFEPSPPSAGKFLRTVWLGLQHNRGKRLRWLRECAHELTLFHRRRRHA